MANEVQLKNSVGEQIIQRVNSLCEAGFSMPKDFNYVNAIKMSMLKLQELKDKNGKPALEVCDKASVQTALFKMCCRGLNAAMNQCYLIVRGNQLCCDDSYFGKVLMVKRIYPEWNPNPVVIREGDVFEYAINPSNGKKYVVKHEQKIANIDNDFVGGYMYLPTGDLFIMTRKQIMTAWAKSSSREQATHKAFSEKMVGKTLVNSGCNIIINSTPEYAISMDEETSIIENKLPSNGEYADFEEVKENSETMNVDKETGEIKPSAEQQTMQAAAESSQSKPNDELEF